MKLILPLFTLIFFLISSEACPQAKDTFKPIPENQERKKVLRDRAKSVNIGMSKEKLYKLFGRYYRTGYVKKGKEEWITFGDRIRKDVDRKITFYLKDGKVRSWQIE